MKKTYKVTLSGSLSYTIEAETAEEAEELADEYYRTDDNRLEVDDVTIEEVN